MWEPSADFVKASNLIDFTRAVEKKYDLSLGDDYERLWEWSVDRPDHFWESFWEWSGIVASRAPTSVCDDFTKMPGARWFEGARLNFAENLLRPPRLSSRGRSSSEAASAGEEEPPAFLFYSETARAPTVVTRRELKRRVGLVARGLQAAGVRAGDRVVGLLSNTPDACAAMLASSSLGAVWASCSPDFGDKAVLDRFAQINPKVLFCVDGYRYKGKLHETIQRLPTLVEKMPSLRQVVVVPGLPVGHSQESDAYSARAAKSESFRQTKGAVTWGSLGRDEGGDGGGLDLPPVDDSGAVAQGEAEPLAQLPFDHPVYIMFSSGTTGLPKCMVQGAGGVLLKHLSELQLLCDLKPGERVFFYSTTGWMMWNWVTSALGAGSTVVCYEGDPMHPTPHRLWEVAEHAQVHVFGASARYLSAQQSSGVVPKEVAALGNLRTILSTGSPAAGNIFEYAKEKIGDHIQFGSMSGGTDLNGCFAGMVPTKAVLEGELQGRCLGMDVRVYRTCSDLEAGADSAGAEAWVGEKGELVCAKAFPSMPLYFWDDEEGAKYHEAYFAEYPGKWRHGDFCELTAAKGLVIHGRSDATLNPGGVRIGTADLYRVVEEDLSDVASDAVVVGEDFLLEDGTPDVRIVLFLKLRRPQNGPLDHELVQRVKGLVRSRCSPRHVPAKVLACPDVPNTVNGKRVEIAVKKAILGEPVRNRAVLKNPGALDFFREYGAALRQQK